MYTFHNFSSPLITRHHSSHITHFFHLLQVVATSISNINISTKYHQYLRIVSDKFSLPLLIPVAHVHVFNSIYVLLERNHIMIKSS